MKQKILVVQLRSRVYANHEKMCFRRNAGKHYKDIRFLNIFYKKGKLPKNHSDLGQYSCVIIAGTGEYSLAMNHRSERKIPKSLFHLQKLIIKHDYPYLGICFGHQLLGSVLGTRVVKDRKQSEIGSYKLYLKNPARSDDIFSKLNDSFWVQEGHNDTLSNIPKGCVLLGSTKRCKAQALRYRRNVYSVQYHPEMTSKQSWERDKLYTQLNPDLGYETKTNTPKDSPDQTLTLNLFLSRYHKTQSS